MVWLADGLFELIYDYFSDLFTWLGGDYNAVLRHIHHKVSNAQNLSLLRHFEAWEVKEALFAMHLDNAPYPDGMNPGFYQKFWDVTGSKVTSTILDFLNNSYLPDGFNKMLIVLIAKVKSPAKLMDLRLISLCNVVYKVFFKVLVNRLKLVLPGIISDT